MRGVLLTLAVAALVACAVPAPAATPDLAAPLVAPPQHTRSETLWIFDADFEDLVGDNAGWVGTDRSGTLAVPNHWHKDTIRIGGFEHLGDSTWWCGTYNPCWIQPRGYGNGWVDVLQRHFDEATGLSPGDELIFEYDQRIAMEKDYDYGYVDISVDGGDSWTTLSTVCNPGFVGTPGYPQDWDSTNPLAPGHESLDLGAYAGHEFDLRFRFESDGALSAQDDYDSGVTDGAWQLDNFVLWVDEEEPVYLFVDDCESPGDNGWAHDEIPATGQAGVAYERRYETFEGRSGWVMAAYDTISGGMVDGQHSNLLSPPINVAGAPALVGRWEGYLDMPGAANDLVSLWLSVSDIPECLDYHSGIEPAWWPSFGGPYWLQMQQDWTAYTGEDWLGLDFDAWNSDPSATHGVGFALDRVRVGVPLETGVPDAGGAHAALGRPHPSPFSTETSLAWSVSAKGRATIRVVDVAGRAVRTLLDRTVEPGDHTVVWDGKTDAGTRAASGVYFARLEFAGGEAMEEATRKVILLD
jgi:hypothetical protein